MFVSVCVRFKTVSLAMVPGWPCVHRVGPAAALGMQRFGTATGHRRLHDTQGAKGLNRCGDHSSEVITGQYYSNVVSTVVVVVIIPRLHWIFTESRLSRLSTQMKQHFYI